MKRAALLIPLAIICTAGFFNRAWWEAQSLPSRYAYIDGYYDGIANARWIAQQTLYGLEQQAGATPTDRVHRRIEAFSQEFDRISRAGLAGIKVAELDALITEFYRRAGDPYADLDVAQALVLLHMGRAESTKELIEAQKKMFRAGQDTRIIIMEPVGPATRPYTY
jgi:hypothetical protein